MVAGLQLRLGHDLGREQQKLAQLAGLPAYCAAILVNTIKLPGRCYTGAIGKVRLPRLAVPGFDVVTWVFTMFQVMVLTPLASGRTAAATRPLLHSSDW